MDSRLNPLTPRGLLFLLRRTSPQVRRAPKPDLREVCACGKGYLEMNNLCDCCYWKHRAAAEKASVAV